MCFLCLIRGMASLRNRAFSKLPFERSGLDDDEAWVDLMWSAPVMAGPSALPVSFSLDQSQPSLVAQTVGLEASGGVVTMVNSGI